MKHNRSAYPFFLLVFSVSVAAWMADGATEAVQHREEVLTLQTYPWYDDPHPVLRAYEGSIYYPYSRQDLISKAGAPHDYRALILENDYLRVTCIPELGGRIWSVLVKATGREMFHHNDVVKPALIAMRGAWISGGIEWNSGPQGHTVTVVSPVDVLTRENSDGSATLVIGNVEKIFRTRWVVEVTLHPGRAYLDETIRMYNPTDTVAPYYFWNCTAFPNLEGTRFIYPMTLGTDHNGTSFFEWPVHEGKDLSYLKNYETMYSIFGYECDHDFFGAYDTDLDQGIVSYANHHELPGKKAWTWGKDEFGIASQMSLSDAGPVNAQYIEVQSGPLLTQSDYGMLKPGREIRWCEFWYPAHGLGDGFEFATRDIVAQTSRTGEMLQLRLLATAEYPGARVTAAGGGKNLLEAAVDLSPLKAQRLDIAAGDIPVEITVAAADGSVLMRYVSPLELRKVDAPDLTVSPAREDGPTADELYEEAFLLHSQTKPDEAWNAYQAVLEQDPLHAPALCGLAGLALGRADWTNARTYAEKAARRDPGSADAWYDLGVALLHLDEPAAAMAAAFKAALTPDKDPRGFYLAGRAAMVLGDYAEALRLFDRAYWGNGCDTAARNGRLAALLAAGNTAEAAQSAQGVLEKDPADFTLKALYALATDTCDAYSEALGRDCGDAPFALQEAACFIAGMGLYSQGARLLEAALQRGLEAPLTRYHAAWCFHKAGDDAAAAAHLKQAAALMEGEALPSRPEELPVLEYALAGLPDSGRVRLSLGLAYAHFGRLDDAVTQWLGAVELEPSLGCAWRLLALHAWKKENTPEKAAKYLRSALEALPGDQILYRDLALVLEPGNRREAIALVESMPKTADVRYDITTWLAKAYLTEARYDDCIALLEVARFSNWEAQTAPRDIFVAALLARGKGAHEAGRLDAALQDFERATTYPENLEVGRPYVVTDAEIRYWIGKTNLALGRADAAREAWEQGAGQRTADDPPLPFVTVTAGQDEYVRKCRTALELFSIGGGF
ncbi:MAG: Tetratricopeptide repeat protein [Candidatus Hydrogenedentes bacterium ADurb.Bin101]|nr:MAG: Tetratricopeptide repeat protein [Candidatus Hydrogenedentes bacterium ADurb.Bin101]